MSTSGPASGRIEDYQTFLRSKVAIAEEHGAAFSRDRLNPNLFEFQKDIALWMIRGGNRAAFASFGMGKTLIQIQVLQAILEMRPGSGLIVCPLGVRGEFMRDAQRFFNITPQYVRTNEEHAEYLDAGQRFFITNYERVRDGNLDPNRFAVVSLDEASVLRSYGSKTYQTFLTLFAHVPFKFVCTATPSPNRFKELIHYAGFLGVMDTGQALTRFFKRDSQSAGNLTIHPHKEREFWLWVSSWATFLTKPSDLSYSDDGYDLPPLKIIRHRLPVDHSTAGFDSWGQGKLLRDAAIGVQDAAREKRDSMADRIQRMVQIVQELSNEQGIFSAILSSEQGEVSGAQPCGLPAEQGCQEDPVSRMENSQPGTMQGVGQTKRGEESRQDGCPESGMVLGKQDGSPRRNKSSKAKRIRPHAEIIQSNAIQPTRTLPNLPTADEEARDRPRSQDGQGAGNPLRAMQRGSRPVSGQRGDSTASGPIPDQFIVWCDLNDEQRAVEKALDAMGISHSSLHGSMAIDERESLLEDWRAGRTTAFVSKPVMYGAGINMQQAHTEIFLGIGFKFADFLQGIHRVYRFLQTHEVHIHLIYTESEDAVHDSLMLKWKQHEKLVENMRSIIQQYGLNNAKQGDEMRRSIGVTRQEAKGDLFTAVNEDNVIEMESFEANSVDLVVTSWPFSNHYEYTEKYNDFGHNTDDARFFEQMDYLTPLIVRALRPGRIYAVHCKDRLLYGSVTGLGMYSVNPFSDKCAAHLSKHGLIHCGRITIVTDVVRENNQTYRLGWTENCKDGSKMGVGSPEYILLFRKLPTDQTRAYADTPVLKEKPDVLCSEHEWGMQVEGVAGEPCIHCGAPYGAEEPRPMAYTKGEPIIPGTGYSRSRWQFDASPFWRSRGNRFLTPEEIQEMRPEQLRSLWHDWNSTHLHDHEQHVKIAEILEAKGLLPASFMLLDPKSHSPWCLDDVVRMRTLNTHQARNRVEGHICPLQIDIVERLIERYSMPGELVLDPFAGLHTVPYVAVLKGRKGYGIELSSEYWADGVGYCRSAEQKVSSPMLFDALEDMPA